MFKYKKDIDRYFMENWHNSAIQFDGASFNMPQNNRWISVKLIPLQRDLIGMDGQGGRKSSTLQLQVLCYDTSATQSYALAQEVMEWLECREIDAGNGTKLKVGLAEGDGNGAVPLENGIYETMIQFDIINYE